jgi:hypothetical protein
LFSLISIRLPRKSLWIILAVLVGAICSPAVMADTIDGTFSFTVSPGIELDPAASFVFDENTNQFTAFTVDWAGVGFDFTAAANSYSALSSCDGDDTFFQILTSPSCSPGRWGALLGPFAANFQFSVPPDTIVQVNEVLNGEGTVEESDGTYTVSTTTVSTPEPSALALTLTGGGLLWLSAGMRKYPLLRLRKYS